jgi:hypothetical protein
VTLNGRDGPLVAILIGLDLPDRNQAEAFVAEVADKFKAQRMLSPPETARLCVTLIGELSAEEFARRWKELA